MDLNTIKQSIGNLLSQYGAVSYDIAQAKSNIEQLSNTQKRLHDELSSMFRTKQTLEAAEAPELPSSPV